MGTLGTVGVREVEPERIEEGKEGTLTLRGGEKEIG